MRRRAGLDLRPVAALALAHGVFTTVAVVLAGLGADDRVAASVLLPATLLLLALAVALNSVLRLEGLTDDGLPAAAGVLGAALAVLGRAYLTVRQSAPISGGDGAESWALIAFARVEVAGFLLTGAWAAHAGWSVHRLLARASVFGWGCIATGVLAAGLAGGLLLRGGGDVTPAGPAAALVRGPVAAFSFILAVAAWLGQPPRANLPSE
ncbi:MAG: hypothetical protein H0V09_08895 [Gemmatimonadetes bacterium]|nr:hypothetical protein [Gemmatimonadota bacterium]